MTCKIVPEMTYNVSSGTLCVMPTYAWYDALRTYLWQAISHLLMSFLYKQAYSSAIHALNSLWRTFAMAGRYQYVIRIRVRFRVIGNQAYIRPPTSSEIKQVPPMFVMGNHGRNLVCKGKGSKFFLSLLYLIRTCSAEHVQYWLLLLYTSFMPL